MAIKFFELISIVNINDNLELITVENAKDFEFLYLSEKYLHIFNINIFYSINSQELNKILFVFCIPISKKNSNLKY